MTTPGTASTTDARKRQADRETDEQPPQFPDTSNFNADLTGLLNRYCAEAPSGTPDFILSTFLQRVLQEFNEAVSARAEWRGEQVDLDLTPPPVEPEPSAAQLAWFDYRKSYEPNASQMTASHKAFIAGYEAASADAATHDPETHVPVERALIERAGTYGTRNMARLAQEFPIAADLIEELSLAALADGAES